MNRELPPVGDWSGAMFAAAARARLDREPGEGVFDPNRTPARGDHDLNRNSYPGFGEPELWHQLRPAAVLVGIIERDSGLKVLLTLRPDHLKSHAGQIAFPGGKIEPSDRGPLAAALREAEEEIGLPAALAEPLGYLDGYQTGTGYRVQPVVALVDAAFDPRLDANEVSELFEVPLAFLVDPANHQRHAREWQGRQRHYYAMPYPDGPAGERYIWGATAGMLRNLYERLIG